jgi:GNAT superfamily N-acetyltransferase
MKYKIVQYNPDLRSQILELQKHLWNEDIEVNNAYFRWKYEQNPYVDIPLIYLATCEERVVGMRGMIGAKWEVGHPPKRFLIPCAGDTVIAPEHRNRGLFTMIMKAALRDLEKRGFRYIFNVSPSTVTLLGSLTIGFRGVGPVENMIRKTKQRIVAPVDNPFNLLDRNFEPRNSKARFNVVTSSKARPKAMAELIARIESNCGIKHVRDREYFSWRFKNPLCQYRFLFWEDNTLQGYLVLQTPSFTNRGIVNIVDWEGTRPEVKADLLEASVDLGKFHKLIIWSATLLRTEKEILQRFGFVSEDVDVGLTNYSQYVMIRAVQDKMLNGDWILANRRLLDLGNWDLRMIYSDGN